MSEDISWYEDSSDFESDDEHIHIDDPGDVSSVAVVETAGDGGKGVVFVLLDGDPYVDTIVVNVHTADPSKKSTVRFDLITTGVRNTYTDDASTSRSGWRTTYFIKAMNDTLSISDIDSFDDLLVALGEISYGTLLSHGTAIKSPETYGPVVGITLMAKRKSDIVDVVSLDDLGALDGFSFVDWWKTAVYDRYIAPRTVSFLSSGVTDNLMLVSWSGIPMIDNIGDHFVFNDLEYIDISQCDQMGCANLADIVYTMKRTHQVGTNSEIRVKMVNDSLLYIRKFCRRHSKRGKNDTLDADDNYGLYQIDVFVLRMQLQDRRPATYTARVAGAE